jgi:hypothetical protein
VSRLYDREAARMRGLDSGPASAKLDYPGNVICIWKVGLVSCVDANRAGISSFRSRNGRRKPQRPRDTRIFHLPQVIND